MQRWRGERALGVGCCWLFVVSKVQSPNHRKSESRLDTRSGELPAQAPRNSTPHNIIGTTSYNIIQHYTTSYNIIALDGKECASISNHVPEAIHSRHLGYPETANKDKSNRSVGWREYTLGTTIILSVGYTGELQSM